MRLRERKGFHHDHAATKTSENSYYLGNGWYLCEIGLT